jgi:hypothetical protein
MAVLDHHGTPTPIAHHTPQRAEPNGYLAVCNVSLVFIAILALAYILSLFV